MDRLVRALEDSPRNPFQALYGFAIEDFHYSQVNGITTHMFVFLDSNYTETCIIVGIDRTYFRITRGNVVTTGVDNHTTTINEIMQTLYAWYRTPDMEQNRIIFST